MRCSPLFSLPSEQTAQLTLLFSLSSPATRFIRPGELSSLLAAVTHSDERLIRPRLGRTIEQTLSADKHLGPIDMSTLEDGQKMVEVATPSSSSTAVAALSGVPSSASACLNLDDFEKAAEALLKPKAWGVCSLSAGRLSPLFAALFPRR